MTNYVFPTQGGLSRQHGPWKVGVWIQADLNGFGELAVVGHETEAGWIVTAIIDGPHMNFQQRIDQLGGMGNWAYAVRPTINAALKRHYDLTPEIPPLSNQTPYTRDNLNFVLSEFFKIDIDTNDQVPVYNPRY